MRYVPGGRIWICGPFSPPLLRNCSPSWKLLCPGTTLAKILPGGTGSPSMESRSPTSSCAMVVKGTLLTR